MFSVNTYCPSTRGIRVLTIFCMITLLVLINTQVFASANYRAQSFEDLSAALASIGQTKAVLTVSSPQRISRNITIPPHISLKFEPNGLFKIDHGKTITIESPLQAGSFRIFEGSGSVVVKHGEVLPQWWGAKGDGVHDDGFAIQDAINSVHAGGGGTVKLPKGTYLLNHISGAYYALKSKDKVSVIGEGNGSILKVGNNLRTATRGVAVLYNHEEPVTHCRFAHFSVDYNGKANLRLASWGDARASNVSRLGAEFASDVLVEHIDFKNVTGAHCVYFGNQPSNNRITIRNCSVFNVGQSVPGNQLEDHSSIYIGGTNGIVTGNTFYNKSPCNISTAIEIHGRNMTMENNSVTNYSTAVNIVAQANDCSDVVLMNNAFKNCGNGVVLWHYSPYILKNILITANTISIREPDVKYPPSFGIVYGNNYVTSNSNMNGLIITNNTMYQESFNTTSTKPNTAIHIESADDVTISGNIISNFKGEAVYVQSRSTQSMRGINITDNVITDVGRTTSKERKRAIVFNAYQTPAGSISLIQVQNNRINSNKDNPMIYGITFNSGFFSQVMISGNTISGATTSEINNNSTQSEEAFLVEHSGKGSPVNVLRAGNGSTWTDITTGKRFTFQEGAWK